MKWAESAKCALAASGGDTVKLFDISAVESPQRDPCTLTYTPSRGSQINSIKWNHTNLVLASAGDDKRISLWSKKGKNLGSLPADSGDNTIEESILTLSFSNKGSRYICSGGTGRVVRIWDLKQKRCVKSLKGHTDTITGTVYNCKDEHLASISLKGDLIVHNLASGARAAELKDPNKQVLRVLDYSRMSRHLLVTAGDDGSIHLWDTTGRSPKYELQFKDVCSQSIKQLPAVSWLKQHSAPISGVSFSPSNDKIIASVGLDKKIYTFDTGSRRPSFCIPYEAPFSSLAFTDDGLTLAAGTNNGRVVFYDFRGKPEPITVLRAYGNSEAVTNLCWQRSTPIIVNEDNCTAETALLGPAGAADDSVLMPDPLPSMSSSILSASTSISGSRNLTRFGSADLSANSSVSIAEETPLRSSLLTSGTLTRLHATRNYNFKDDMEVFSPLVEIQPITPTLDKLWDDHEGAKKDVDKKQSLLFPSRRFTLSEEGGNGSHPLFDWKSNSTSKQDDARLSLSQFGSTSTSMHSDEPTSITPPEAWGGERFSDKFIHLRQSANMPSRFSMLASSTLSSGSMLPGLQDITAPAIQSNMTKSLGLADIRSGEASSFEPSLDSSGHVSSFSIKGTTNSVNLDSLGPALSLPRKFSSYAERISASSSFNDATNISIGSPKSKKTGAETKEEIFNNLPRAGTSTATGNGALLTMNGGLTQSQKTPLQPDMQQGNSFTLQLFQRTLEETLASFQKSIHEDVRNLHIEILRQFHLQETEMSNMMNVVLENQAEIMKEIQELRKETQRLRQLL